MLVMAKKKPTGRPKTDKPRKNAVQFRLTDEEQAATDAYFATLEFPPSTSDAVRRVWLNFLASKGFRVQPKSSPDAGK